MNNIGDAKDAAKELSDYLEDVDNLIDAVKDVLNGVEEITHDDVTGFFIPSNLYQQLTDKYQTVF